MSKNMKMMKYTFTSLVLLLLQLNLYSQNYFDNPGEPGNADSTKSSLTIGNQIEIDLGYGLLPSNQLTTAISSVGEKDFNTAGVVSPQQLIQGKVVGTQIFSQDGSPGTNYDIFIRGQAMMKSSDQPLIIVDGMPYIKHETTGGFNSLDGINPEDIASITVLRDVAASAIYGIRAENGAILISTKKGNKHQKLKLTYSGNFSLSNVPGQFGVIEADDYRPLVNERFANNPGVISLLGDANTNWQDEIYRQASGNNHLLGLAGYVWKIPFRLSLGYTGQQGIVKTSQMKRTSGSLTLNPVFFDDHLAVDVSVRASRIANQYLDHRVISSALLFDPTQNVYDTDSPYGGYFTWTNPDGTPTEAATINPVALIDLSDFQAKTNRFTGNFHLGYKLHFLPDLSVHLSAGISNEKADYDEYVPEYASWTMLSYASGGKHYTNEIERKNATYNALLKYQKELSGIKSKINVIAGLESQKFNYNYQALFANADGSYIFDDYDYAEETSISSYFGRLNYSLADKYLLMFSWRRDGQSIYSEDNRWGNSTAFGLGWVISKEKFLRNASWLDLLKIRYSYGVIGKQNEDKIDPHSLKMQETASNNLGLDAAFLKSRFRISVDVYSSNVRDFPFYKPVPGGTNLTDFVLVSEGEIEYKGIEFTMGADILKKPVVSWKVLTNFSWSKNEIIELLDELTDYGLPVGMIEGGVGNTVQILSPGYPNNTFAFYEQVYATNGQPIEGMYEDVNQDGVVSYEDILYKEDPAPKFMLGLTSLFQYKNWQFDFAGRLNLGNFVYNNTESYMGFYSKLYSPYGPFLSNISSGVVNSNFENPQYLSNYYLEDASFFRMDYLKLAYNFRFFNKMDLQLYLAGQNLFVVTGYSGQDPEVPQGIDYAPYPRPRVFLVGVNLNL
jgi:iron complex outermembrane receptor protein